MANSKITELTELTSTESTDVLAIVDDSELPKTTKKITIQNLINSNNDVSQNTSHRSNTSNPHGITKAQVGISNVDNTSDLDKPVSTQQAIANTQDRSRENHTGTQDASTISDLKTFLDNYHDRTSIENNTPQSVTGTTFVDRLSQNITPKNTAKYIITLSYTWRHNSTVLDMVVEMLIDGVVERTKFLEPKDEGADQSVPSILRKEFNATSATPFNIQVRFRSSGGANTSTMITSNVTIERFGA